MYATKCSCFGEHHLLCYGVLGHSHQGKDCQQTESTDPERSKLLPKHCTLCTMFIYCENFKLLTPCINFFTFTFICTFFNLYRYISTVPVPEQYLLLRQINFPTGFIKSSICLSSLICPFDMIEHLLQIQGNQKTLLCLVLR